MNAHNPDTSQTFTTLTSVNDSTLNHDGSLQGPNLPFSSLLRAINAHPQPPPQGAACATPPRPSTSWAGTGTTAVDAHNYPQPATEQPQPYYVSPFHRGLDSSIHRIVVGELFLSFLFNIPFS